MVNMIISMFKALFSFLKIPLFLAVVFILIFIVAVLLQMLILDIKGVKREKGIHIKPKKRNLFLRLFWDAPKQYAADIYAMPPDYFRYQGLIIYSGRQGAGKTVAMIEHIMRMQKEYPLSKCTTNIKYKYQDIPLKHWKQLTDYKNGNKGVIVGIDEFQNWFSSNQSRNFPPEMLGVVTQNRKTRRIIVGTTQNYYLLAKAIRTQTTEVRDCLTLAGVITIVRRKEPFLNSEGEVIKWKHRGIYMFVHNKMIRDAYDTYEVVENLTKSGFKEKMRIEVE